MKKHRRTYEELNLDKKIQYLIWTLAIPMVFCILLPVVSMFISIGNYSTITHNMNLSSDFAYHIGAAYSVYTKNANRWVIGGEYLHNYLEAIERNPESPAVSARDMIMNILNFYNK